MSDTEVQTQKSVGNTRPPTSLRSRSWVLTLWDEESLKVLIDSKPDYLIYAPEVCPKTGKHHFQCYAYYKNPRKTDFMRHKYKGNDVQLALGTHLQNKTYIQGPYKKGDKEKPHNPNAVEIGKLPTQGERSDLREFHEAIKTGKRGRDLSVDHLEIRAKYPKLEATLVNEEDEQRAIQMFKEGFCPEVHVRWGKPGTGKSRYVYDKHDAESIYELNLGDGSSKSVWWDGYRGQEVILINDFSGELGWKYLLRLLDRYPFRMQIKGSHCWRLCKYIYITANEPPVDWYRNEQSGPLLRRIKSIVEVV